MPIPNKKIFCNVPWNEIHIYWDGGLGICHYETHRLHKQYEENFFILKKRYNIIDMSMSEWFNSEPVKKFRHDMWGNNLQSACGRCYDEELKGQTSRRHRNNFKSQIYTRSSFDETFSNSKDYKNFLYSKEKQGETTTKPIKLHIDLGNYCNLACKMCSPVASSKIAAQHVKWGRKEDSKYLGVDWTKNETVWNKFLNDVVEMKIPSIHFMGGETTLTRRFHDFLDFMIAKNNFNINLTFVTNGVTFDKTLMEKLKLFRYVDIEISMETTTKHNDYIRQGTDTVQVLENVKKYLEWCNNDKISITLRSAVSILSIGNYDSLIEYCLKEKLKIRPLIVNWPRFMQVNILPEEIKKEYETKYYSLLDRYDLKELDIEKDFLESDSKEYKKIAKQAIIQVLGLLKTQNPYDQETQLENMVDHCRRWDSVYGFDARLLYPELKDIFEKYNYNNVS